MKRMNSLTMAGMTLFCMGSTFAAHAQDFTAGTQNGAPAPNAAPVISTTTSTAGVKIYTARLTVSPTDVIAIATVQVAGRRTGANGYNFLNIEGDGNTTFASYGLLRFDLNNVKSQLTAHFGSPSSYTIKDIYLALAQSNAAFSHSGTVLVNFINGSDADTSTFGFGPPYTGAGTQINPDLFKYPGPAPSGQEFVSQYTYLKGGPLGPDPTNTLNPNGNGTIDYVPLYGEVPAGLPINDGAGTTAPETPIVNSAANNNGQNNTDLLNHFKNSSKLTLSLNPDNANTAAVAASYEGATGFFPLTVDQTSGQPASTTPYQYLYAPQIVVVASPATNVTGTIAFDSVAYPHTGGIPLNTVTVTFLQGTTVVATQTATVNPTDGSYSVTAPASGTYNIRFKGSKNLSVLKTSVVISGGAAGVNATLPGGDATGDNIVDIGDFGLLVNAYGGDNTVSGSSYSAAADFNDDGIVDIGDFGILVNNYGNSGQ